MKFNEPIKQWKRSPAMVGRLLVFLLLTLTLASCVKPSTEPSKKRVFKLGKQMVWLERPDASDPFFRNRKFKHPYRLNPEEMERQINSFQYKGLALLSKKKKVFPQRNRTKKMAALVLIGLDKARPDEIVKFKFIFKKNKETTGDLFITGGKMHWRFDMIQGKEYSRHGARNWVDSWKLILGKNQKYHGAAGLFGSSAVKNWMVMPIRKTELSTETAPPSLKELEKKRRRGKGRASDPEESLGEERGRGKEKKLEKALARLKRLRKKELITEEEYKKQKAELLKKSFE